MVSSNHDSHAAVLVLSPSAYIKGLVVLVSDTVVEPRAVVVHLENTPVAGRTVMCPIWLFKSIEHSRHKEGVQLEFGSVR